MFLSCDETPPYVQIIYPVEGAVMQGLDTIQAEAYDNDGDGKVVSVDFFIDGIWIGTDNHAPWEYPWNVSYWADDEDHTITAKAYDYSNNIGQSNIVTVKVPEGVEILPTLIEPELTQEIDNTNRPLFTWFGLPNTNKYEIEISMFNDIIHYYQYEDYVEEFVDFENSIIDTSVIDTFFIVPEALTDETTGFYWHIRGENELGNLTEWSDTWVFKITGPGAPILNYPSIHDTVFSLPIFNWLNTASAHEYNIILSEVVDDDCQVGNVDNCFINIAFSHFLAREPGQTQDYTSQQEVTIESGIHWWKVRSKNENDIWGEWSEETYFVMSAPNIPNILYPPNGEIIRNTNQPEFNWNNSEGADIYRIQISEDFNFENNNIIDTLIYNNNFNLLETSQFLNEGTNYWRINASNNTDAWSGWSSVYQFRISGSLPPNIIEPFENQIYTQGDTLTFIWEESLYADMYQIQINYNESESIMRDVIIENIDNLIYEFTDLSYFLFDDSYFRIRARNNLGYWGDWSSCEIDSNGETLDCNSIKDYIRFYYTPAAPILYYPIEQDLLFQPSFSWQSIQSADKYRIQLSNDQTFEDIIIDEIVTDSDFYTENYNFESYSATTLYWRIQSIVNTYNDILEGAWSEMEEFSAIIPSAPILESPINNFVINENLQFEWTDIEGVQNYQILVSNHPNFNNNGTIINTTTIQSQLHNPEYLNIVEEGYYYWKVRSKSELGIWSEYSNFSIFEADSPPLPELIAPENLLILNEMPILVWESLINLNQYQIQIINESTGEILIDNYINSTNYTISSDNLNGGTHLWRVRGVNNMEMWSDWTEFWYFWIPYQIDIDLIYLENQNFSIAKYPITTEQYVDFLNESYHDSLEYLVIRDQYIKGYCEGMPDNEEQIFIKRATSSDIYPYNLAKIRWNSNEELFYFEGSNELSYLNHPIIFVSWCGATAFAKHYNLELPSVEEWENSVSNSGWSNEIDGIYVNYLDSGDNWDNGTTPVNNYQYPFSDLNDPLGNIWEWTNDIQGSERSCKGGSFLNMLEDISIDSTRSINNGPNSVNKDVGFRILKRY